MIPDFRAAACLGGAASTSSGPPTFDGADDSVRPTQLSRLDSILDVLKPVGSLGEARYAYPSDMDCPSGQRPTLVCVDAIPILYCEWTGVGSYRCYVKEWKCLPGGYEWQCQPVKLHVFGA